MPERVLLDSDTLHIGFYQQGAAPYPEDIIGPAVLRAIAQHLQIDLETEGVFWGDYCYFAGVQGEAFRFLEFMKLASAGDKPVLENYGRSVTACYGDALDAAGLTYRAHLKPDWPARDQLRNEIVASLRDRGTPVIAFGFFGPPEPMLITGYDPDGDAIIGWSHFQNDKKDDARISFEAGGQFRMSDWYDAISGVIVITGRKDKAPAQQVYRSAIERGISDLLKTEGKGGAIGTAAMDKWAEHLENDADFAGFTDAQWKKAMEDHGGTAGDLAERRALANDFVGLAGRAFPAAADDLNTAGACFGGSHDTVYEIWETVARTGPFDPDLEKFKDPQRRRTMAGLVRRIADADRRAAAALTRALAIIDGKQAGEKLAPDDLLDGNLSLLKADRPAIEAQPIWAPENIAIANSMCMLQEFLGEPFGELNEQERASKRLAYALWMGYTGAAFGMLSDSAEYSNIALGFDALGYDYELWMDHETAGKCGLPARTYGWDDNFRRRVYWNLRDRQLPVLLFNCGAWPDWWLITGVENRRRFRGYGGDNGEGYRPNEPLDDAKNALKEIELIADMKDKHAWSINVLRKRTTPKPTMEQLYQRAIEWGARKMRQPRMTVLSAAGVERMSDKPYEDWAAMMLADELFPPGDAEALKSRREWLEGYEVELAERRFYGSEFLHLAAIRLGRADLEEAAGRFRKVNDLMEQVWAQTGGMHAPDAHLKYADRSVREKIAGLLLEMQREDAAAAAILAR